MKDAEHARHHKDKEDKKREKKHHHHGDHQNYDTDTSNNTVSSKKQDVCECWDGTVVPKKKAKKDCANRGGVKRCY